MVEVDKNAKNLYKMSSTRVDWTQTVLVRDLLSEVKH